jgi:hypothetical protein
MTLSIDGEYTEIFCHRSVTCSTPVIRAPPSAAAGSAFACGLAISASAENNSAAKATTVPLFSLGTH